MTKHWVTLIGKKKTIQEGKERSALFSFFFAFKTQSHAIVHFISITGSLYRVINQRPFLSSKVVRSTAKYFQDGDGSKDVSIPSKPVQKPFLCTT